LVIIPFEDATNMATNTKLSVTRVTTSIGAVIGGIDLSKRLEPDEVAQIRKALLDHGVVFFHDQELNDAQMNTFVANFDKPVPEPFAAADNPNAPAVIASDLEPHKYSTSVWHTDTSFVPEPPTLTALRAVEPPPFGGDTCWASMYAAYDALSEPIRKLLDGLSAVFSMVQVLKRLDDASRFANNEQVHGLQHVHPLVRVHPETGRKAIYYDEGAVVSIVGLSSAESRLVMNLLREHVKSPDFGMRWHWKANDLALWDNRSVQHYAVPDYAGKRVMQRVVTAGQRPKGAQ
jgi:taurine dioxygenase